MSTALELTDLNFEQKLKQSRNILLYIGVK